LIEHYDDRLLSAANGHRFDQPEWQRINKAEVEEMISEKLP
jgi:hypothetical protein